MNRKNLIRAMTAFALVALVVGVLVWPTPKEALAYDQLVTVTIDWNIDPTYNIAAHVNFYDANWGLTGSMNLTPNGTWTAWSGTYLLLPVGTTRVKIYWDDSVGDWTLSSAQVLPVSGNDPVTLALSLQ